MSALVMMLVLCSASRILAIFSKEDEVKPFEAAEFQQRVIAKGEVWLIKFYSPECPHCTSFEAEFKKAARVLKGIVNVGVVDIKKNSRLGSTYAPDGVPNVLLFNLENATKSFTGARTAAGVVEFVQESFNALITKRLGIKPSSDGKSKTSTHDYLMDGSVIVLTDNNFDSEMAKKPEVFWLVEFFAPWCGHCKSLEPSWKLAAKRLKGVAILATVDATVHNKVASRFDINGFPTIKAFLPSAHSKPKEYDGPRDPDGIVDWVMQQNTEGATLQPDIIELTSQKQMDDATSHIICVISFLPHLLDCQSDCRNNHIAMLKEMSSRFRKNEWSWLWTQEMAHPDLEESVGVRRMPRGYEICTQILNL